VVRAERVLKYTMCAAAHRDLLSLSAKLVFCNSDLDHQYKDAYDLFVSQGRTSHKRTSWAGVVGVHLIGVHLINVHIIGVLPHRHVISGVHPTGVYLIGVYLMGVHLIDVYYGLL
jgi:hypothetical protein